MRNPDLERRLEPYFRALARSAKRTGASFTKETSRIDSDLEFRWTAHRVGLGFATFHEHSKRLFIVEWSGRSKGRSGESVKELRRGFRSGAPGGLDQWKISGLSVRLPGPAKLSRFVFQTGRTQLHWLADRCSISAGRSAFGRELIGKSSLGEWARHLAPKGKVVACDQGVAIETTKRKGLRTLYSVTLARMSESTNQLEFVSAMFRDDFWKPRWDWFDLNP